MVAEALILSLVHHDALEAEGCQESFVRRLMAIEHQADALRGLAVGERPLPLAAGGFAGFGQLLLDISEGEKLSIHAGILSDRSVTVKA